MCSHIPGLGAGLMCFYEEDKGFRCLAAWQRGCIARYRGAVCTALLAGVPGSAEDPRNFALFSVSVESKALISLSCKALRIWEWEGIEFTLLFTALSITLITSYIGNFAWIKHSHVTSLTLENEVPKIYFSFLLLDFPLFFLYFLSVAGFHLTQYSV